MYKNPPEDCRLVFDVSNLENYTTPTEFYFLSGFDLTQCSVPFFHCTRNLHPTVVSRILLLPEQIVKYFHPW